MESLSKSTTNSLADWFLWPMPLRNKCIRGKISSFIASRKLIYGNTSVWIDQALDRQCRHYLNIFIWDFFFWYIYIYIYRFAEEIETQALHFPNSCSCRGLFSIIMFTKNVGFWTCFTWQSTVFSMEYWFELPPTLFCCQHVQANRCGL